ncbi:MAG: hypothetical protein ACYC0V_22235, partial [Armatimonadota bacterium]
NIKEGMNLYSYDGVYLDGTTMPIQCANETHGCGYRDESGKLHCTYPIFGRREFMKELYRIVKAKGGFINVHQSSCSLTPLLAFVDSYFDGEHIQGDTEFTIDKLPLDSFCAEFMA